MVCEKVRDFMTRMDGTDLESHIGLINKVALERKSDFDFEELTVAFRNMRNVCAKGIQIQNDIISDRDILKSTHFILQSLLNFNDQNDKSLLCLQIGLQFIANLLVNNIENQAIIRIPYQDFFISCVKFDNEKVQNYACMILYNICLGCPDYMSNVNHIIKDIIYLTRKKDTEFSLYLLQLFVTKTNFIQCVYDSLEPEFKVTIIEVIEDLIQSDGITLSNELIHFFVNQFLNFSNIVLGISQASDPSNEAYTAAKVLNFLAVLSSSNEANLRQLQSKNSLMTHCIMLLKSIHILSREPNNHFSVIEKLSELNEIQNETLILEHPSFGLKSSIIRLIGNLCWKNVRNQDNIRESECLPVLLDSFKIDGRNPLITQWTILAVRNILENNLENQKYISAMPRTGEIDVEKLNRMGIMLNKDSDGSTCSILPLELKQ